MAQTAQLQNTNCLGRNLGKPLDAECSADSKKRQRESEDGVGAVGQYEMMGALGRQLLSAGLGEGAHGLCAAEREMHDVAIMGASVRCGDGAVGSVCQRPAAWHDMETRVRHRPAHAGETIRFQPLPLSRAIVFALRRNRRVRAGATCLWCSSCRATCTYDCFGSGTHRTGMLTIGNWLRSTQTCGHLCMRGCIA